MPTARLKSLRLCVADIKKSRDFYSQLFELTPVRNDVDLVVFEMSGTNLDILLADEKNPLSTGGSIGYFEVENLKHFIERSKEIGAEIWRGPLKINEDGWTIVQIKDIAGNIIGFEGQLP